MTKISPGIRGVDGPMGMDTSFQVFVSYISAQWRESGGDKALNN